MPAHTTFAGRLRAPLLFALAASGAAISFANAQELELGYPLDCVLGDTCYIQQYVDRDPGPGSLDHGCGTLANDGHRGTDFAVPTLADMAKGVAVIAAADGTVLATRDGMPDISADDPAAPDLSGRECGNGVVLTHSDGWVTQYCHLRQDSVAVRNGDRVTKGQQLGLVGMSGEATFPHVHMSVRLNEAVVDPFSADMTTACATQQPESLWIDPPAYRPGGILAAGLSDRVPEYDEVKAGLPEDGLPEAADAVVLWAYFFAGRAGDEIMLEVTGPEGPFGSTRIELERDQPFLFRAWGRRAPAGGWPPGEYSARVSHQRDGTVLDRMQVVATLP